MIFLDTSAIYAMADQGDPNHVRAAERFRHALESRETLLVHNGVLTEAAALLQRRLGLRTAILFLEQSERFAIHWITARDHEEAVELLKDRGQRGLTLVDCTSFAIMRRYQVSQALAFDAHFEEDGFSLYR